MKLMIEIENDIARWMKNENPSFGLIRRRAYRFLVLKTVCN